MLYLHGGAYVGDLTAPYWSLIGTLVDDTGATLVVPAYPLAPRHDWRPAHALVRSVYQQMVGDVGAQNIAIAGDSAGGGLALAIAEELHEQDQPEPAALVMFSPFLDATVSDPSQPDLDRVDHVLSIHGVRQVGRWWAGNLPVTNPRISPLYGSLDGLPPMSVFTGTNDLLYPDAVRLKAEADAARVPCRLTTFRNEIHAWVIFFPNLVPEARSAIDGATQFINSRTT